MSENHQRAGDAENMWLGVVSKATKGEKVWEGEGGGLGMSENW